jgi:deoxyribonuclease-4
MMPAVLLGSHVSVSGGVHTAFERAVRIGCTTMQVFVKNASQWVGKPLTGEDIEKYKRAQAKARIDPVVAHGAYLINLSAVSPATRRRSREALEDELRRCELLGIAGLIFHPGAHMGKGEDEGIRAIAESINHVHDRTPGFRTRTVLETTAGQGTALGHRFAQLAAIIDRVEAQERMGVCLDTCHLFAAGYPIHTAPGWESTMRELEETIGLHRVMAIHVNDSRREFGSRIDRHEHIGKGKIGLTGFQLMMNDPRLAALPKILETEKSVDMHEDVENMAMLRSLLVAS